MGTHFMGTHFYTHVTNALKKVYIQLFYQVTKHFAVQAL